MPEGHTLHRLARLHRKALVGRRVRADSPQGRFAAGAALLDGRFVEDVEAHGKLLFYRWRGLGELLHVHLGLVGTFRTARRGQPPGSATRLRLRTDRTDLHLRGPMACELLTPDERDRLVGSLGPDPLRADADPERARAALQRTAAPIGAALLDQRVVAGIGNVYRAEVLFLCGVDPRRPARDLAGDGFAALWSTLREELRAGERSGRIVTVVPADVGVATRAAVPAADRHYVYQRGGLPCRRCAAPITAWKLGGRTISACPSCQR